MATLNNIPDDVLKTHILPLATEEAELRQRIINLEEVNQEIRNLLEAQKLALMEAQKQLKNHHIRNRKNEKKVTYYKEQVDYLVSASSNPSYYDDY